MIRAVRTLFAAAAALLTLAAAAPAGAQNADVRGPTPPLRLTRATAPSSFGRYQPAALYTEQVRTSFYLPLRDGTRIAINLFRPAVNGRPAEGRFPVILHHTLNIYPEPIDGVGPLTTRDGYRTMPDMTRHGYVVAQIARRGNGQSFGARRGYHDRNEAQDIYELIEWFAAQPWSTGRVGMYGCSNTGDAAMQSLTVRPPHLRAVFAGCFTWNKFENIRRGGMLANWGTGPTRTREQDMSVRPVDGDESRRLLSQAVDEHQLSVSLIDLWRGLPYRDSLSALTQSRFWSEGSVSDYRDQMVRSGVAVYVQGGWRDELRDQNFIAWANLPGARILVGDWLHCFNDDFALNQEMLRFYDYWLKDIDTGIERDPPIHYFAIHGGADGAGEWRSATRWPLNTAADRTTINLGANGELTQTVQGADAPATVRVSYDGLCEGGGEGPRAQPCTRGDRGASFTGMRLGAPVEVTGHPIADLWVSSDQPDAAVFAYLEDVGPDGSVRFVTEGRLMAHQRRLNTPPWENFGLPWHRGYQEDAEPLAPGVPARMQFDLLPTSYVFLPGHRMRVTVTGSDWRERARQIERPPTIRVHTGGATASAISLPIVPARS